MGKMGVIQNQAELSTSALRRDALAILTSGYEAIDTVSNVRELVRLEENILSIREYQYDLATYDRVFFIGIGKCAADAGKVFDEVLGEKITNGIVVDVQGATLSSLKTHVGTHPLPTEKNVKAAQSIAELMSGTTEKDLVLAVISGGGSTLLCLPHQIDCDTIADITRSMTDQGASIREINTVRKHLSDIQGGQLAKLAYPAKIVACVFSDVPGNDPDVIASGPVHLDPTTVADAKRIMDRYRVANVCRLPDCELIETPKDKKYFQNIDTIFFMTNEQAIDAMREKAESLGYATHIENTEVMGEARVVGHTMAQKAFQANPTCHLYGGETTVTVRSRGKGGRNQEVVLGALEALQNGTVIVAAASDGWDNSDVAGAIGDKELYTHCKKTGLDPGAYLKRNASYEFFNKGSGHIRTGRIGANVADFYFTLCT